MSLPIILGCIWVLVATVTALMPMRLQYLPGIPLLIAAPILLIWLGVVHGWLWVAIGLAAFVSMFRRPLIYLGRRALGLPAELPPELERETR